ncbi:TPA: nucleotide-binding protein [Aeromonas dhakensis]|nr:nucleotide-binding protein [Aeromonas dhakensis]
MKPRLFIGSSVEGLGVAYSIQQNLMHDLEATVWDQGVFGLSQTTIDALEKALEASDFGVFVFSPDDMTVMRNIESKTVRDNVIFEFGLFVGKLGRERVFFILPDGCDTHIPTDLLGVTPGKYNPNRQDGSLQAATGAACNQIRQTVKKLGFLNQPKVDNESTENNVTAKIEEREWMHDLIENRFDDARAKLTTLKMSLDGKELLVNEMWSNYIDFRQNNYTCIQPLIDSIKTHTNNIELQVLGLNMLAGEQYDDVVLQLIRELFGEDPQDISVLILKSDCLRNIGEDDQAISALISKSNNPEICIKLSEIYKSSGNKEDAFAIMAKAYRENPNNKEVVYYYARLLLDNDKNKEAAYLLNYLTTEYQDAYEYYGYLSNVCLKLELYDQAMTACRKAFVLSEGKEQWILSNIGNMLNNKGFFGDAIEWLEKSTKLDSTSEYSHDRLARTIKNRSAEVETFSNICKEGKVLLRTAYRPEMSTE